MKAKRKVGGYIILRAVCALGFSVAFIALGSQVQSAQSQSQARAFSFAERVAYQRIIEDVYWRHRIWPKENPDPKPSLDAVMSQAQVEHKVANYLRDSHALGDYGQPITAERLQAEMDRMARDTRQSEVLRELFGALGDDPAVIAECLARPILAERLIADLSMRDETRQVESPHNEELLAIAAVTTLGQLVYTLPEIVDTCTDDTWTATTTANAPLGRSGHTAIWTGSEMIVWGGYDRAVGYLNTGGRYNPSTDSWTATSLTNAPAARTGHTAVWTGSEMIVWGGFGGRVLNTGRRYNPSADSWTYTRRTNAPVARTGHTAVWTGNEMIVWGGNRTIGASFRTGGRYNPGADNWIATSTTNAPTGRTGHTAVWSGSEMIVWGGGHNSGGRYNPDADSWIATSTTDAPTGRTGHTAVWSGSEMIVWGGYFGRPLNTGGKYDPGADSWIPTSTIIAPTARNDHTAVWTDSEMIVWGGVTCNASSCQYLNTGGRYNPINDSWAATDITNAPVGRLGHTAVWTSSEMIAWGGVNGSTRLNTGGRFCAKPPRPSITVIQPNGGEIWTAGSVQQIRWNSNLEHTDHLIIQYSRDGGASWFRIAHTIPAFTFGYWWQVDNFPTTQGRIKILLQENRSITDQSDANFTVQLGP